MTSKYCKSVWRANDSLLNRSCGTLTSYTNRSAKRSCISNKPVKREKGSYWLVMLTWQSSFSCRVCFEHVWIAKRVKTVDWTNDLHQFSSLISLSQTSWANRECRSAGKGKVWCVCVCVSRNQVSPYKFSPYRLLPESISTGSSTVLNYIRRVQILPPWLRHSSAL